MQIEVLKSKLHRATVTQTILDYEGSISIDTNLVKEAGMHLWEKVEIFNINNGARLATYIIPGKKGEFCLNGAAARLAQPGDKIIVVSYTWIDEQDADSWKPRVVLLNEDNSVKQVKA